jgi:hypothetical protein
MTNALIQFNKIIIIVIQKHKLLQRAHIFKYYLYNKLGEAVKKRGKSIEFCISVWTSASQSERKGGGGYYSLGIETYFVYNQGFFLS